MYVFYILGIIFFILGMILKYINKNRITDNKFEIINSPMTKTEIKFYEQLNKIANKYELKIIPQIQLQKIFKTKNISEFNKIKSKSIDFAILDEEYKYILFIELDDYTHNYSKRIKRDYYINELFSKYNLKLLRIKVNNNYNMEIIEKEIKESL